MNLIFFQEIIKPDQFQNKLMNLTRNQIQLINGLGRLVRVTQMLRFSLLQDFPKFHELPTTLPKLKILEKKNSTCI